MAVQSLVGRSGSENEMTMSRGKKPLVVAFRVDASFEIGTGHIMRCLTLALALEEQGAKCHFLSREHPGHLIEAITAHGFTVHRLPIVQKAGMLEKQTEGTSSALTLDTSDNLSQSTSLPAHAGWLGASWEEDAAVSRSILASLAPDWLIVDHYALDTRWEEYVLPRCTRLLVIDDLADRSHCADLLLDQNLGRCSEDYADLVPITCECLIGPRYALLRPEFARLRDKSLARRHEPRLERLMISLGGVDKDNASGLVLEALTRCDLPESLEITVVMGAAAPWLEDVTHRARSMPRATEVVVNVNDMAQRMVDADLAIGAAGSTSWERCCMGLPSILVVLAKNQLPIARALETSGAAACLGEQEEIKKMPEHWRSLVSERSLHKMSAAAANLTDGKGVYAVSTMLHRKSTAI